MKKTIYLYKSGILQRKDSSLVLITKTNQAIYIPVQQIDQIYVFSEVTFNKRTIALLNLYEISIFFFDFYGKYIGRFTPRRYIDGKVLLLQVEAYQNDFKRLYISKRIIESSIKNEMSLLKYYQKKGKEVNNYINMMDESLLKIEKCESIDGLLLIEALAKQQYFSAFDIILDSALYQFEKRTKNPPMNEINAMLSYGYALLYANYLSVLDRSSLMPQISFIHSLSKNCDSLHFDLADVLKPVIVDRLILRLIRKNQVKKEYFEFKEDGRCYLNKEGVSFFVHEYEDTLSNTILVNGKYYSYKNLISKEVHALSNYIKKESKKYKPFLMKW